MIGDASRLWQARPSTLYPCERTLIVPPDAPCPDPRGPNAALIGVPASRQRLGTPCLVLDLDRLERNIAVLQRHASANGYALRPVAKVHKSTAIARRQMAAGAIGQACATLAEAEALAAAGIRGILLFSPVVTAAKIERLIALNARTDGLLVAVDGPEHVDALATANRGRGCRLQLLVDCEVGGGRTGLASPDAAVALARRIEQQGAVLAYAGIQAYCGGIQSIADYPARVLAARAVAERTQAFVTALRDAGLPPVIVSGGGTGTFAIDPIFGVYTECQAGSYVFMDVHYLDVALLDTHACPFLPSLFVRTTVISNAQAGFCITDAGRKEFARDGVSPRLWAGAPAGARYGIVGDDMGRIDFADPLDRLPVGTAVECLTPHAYATLNLYPVYHCVHGDTLIDIWPIDARLSW